MSFLILAAVAAAATNPIAPGLAGKLRCQQPNATAKTCRSIASYKDGGSGQYVVHSSIMLRAEPFVVADSDTRAVVREGMLCGTITSADIDASKISMGGTPLDDAMAAMVKDRIKEGLPNIDKEVCSAFAADATGALTATPVIDGKADAEKTQPYIWVAPEDGYKVGP